MIVLDTSVLSAAYRRSERDEGVREHLARLVAEDAVLGVPGMVFQELLSSARTPEAHRRLETILSAFPLLLATRAIHVAAADLFRAARGAGMSVASPDALIAAHAFGRGRELWALDEDFARLAQLRPLRLHAF